MAPHTQTKQDMENLKEVQTPAALIRRVASLEPKQMFADNPVPFVCLCRFHFNSFLMVSFTAGVRAIKSTDYSPPCSFAFPHFDAALPWKNRFFDSGCSADPCRTSPPLSLDKQLEKPGLFQGKRRVSHNQAFLEGLRYPFLEHPNQTTLLTSAWCIDGDLRPSKHCSAWTPQDPWNNCRADTAADPKMPVVLCHSLIWSRNVTVCAVASNAAKNTMLQLSSVLSTWFIWAMPQPFPILNAKRRKMGFVFPSLFSQVQAEQD